MKSVPQPIDTFGALERLPATPEARSLVDEVHHLVVTGEERKRKRRKADAERFKDAVGRFVGELLVTMASVARGGTGRFWRSLKAESFKDYPVGCKTFMKVLAGLGGQGLVIHTPGSPRFGTGFDGGTTQWKGEASKFEATPALMQMAERHGVRIDEARRHFQDPEKPLTLIVARGSSKNVMGEYHKGALRTFKPSERTKALEAQVRTINDFLSEFSIGGADHRGFYRAFSRCDDVASYQWKQGGRLISDAGEGNRKYQDLSDRSGITINGEGTVEIDITASQLTILLALTGTYSGMGMGADPYTAVFHDRDLVKGWMVASLGMGKLCEQWPRRVSASYADKHDGRKPGKVIKAQEMKEAALKRYPALGRVKRGELDGANLTYVESEIIITAMTILMHQGKPSLPVHDSLIVRVSEAGVALGALYQSFYSLIGAVPRLTVEGSDDQLRDEAERLMMDYAGKPGRGVIERLRLTEC